MSVPRQCSGPELPLEDLLSLIQWKVTQFMLWDWDPSLSREDLVQEVVIRVLQRLGRHNPCRSRFITFISRIVDSILVDVWREFHAQKRHPRSPITGLDEISERHRENLVDAESASSRARDLKSDVRTEINQLPPDLAGLANDLLTLDVGEMAAKYDVHRGTVQRKLQKLQLHWKDSPLRLYLDRPVDH